MKKSIENKDPFLRKVTGFGIYDEPQSFEEIVSDFRKEVKNSENSKLKTKYSNFLIRFELTKRSAIDVKAIMTLLDKFNIKYEAAGNEIPDLMKLDPNKYLNFSLINNKSVQPEKKNSFDSKLKDNEVIKVNEVKKVNEEKKVFEIEDKFNNQARFRYQNSRIVPHPEHSVLIFRSNGEIAIFDELIKRDLLFLPLPVAVLGKIKTFREPDFLICHNGKWGILEVDGEFHEKTRARDNEIARLFKTYGIIVYEAYEAKFCKENPEKVVDNFLHILEKTYGNR